MRLPRLVIPTVVAVLAGSAVTYAATNSSNSIDGCVDTSGKGKGDLRVLTGNGKCAKGETEISWNKTGPSGAPGATGATGGQGSAGAPGPKGDTGAPGAAAPAVVIGGSSLDDGKFDAYMKIGSSTDGDSKAPGHEGWFTLKSVQLGGEQSVDSSNRPSSIMRFGSVQVTKVMDSSSSRLWQLIGNNFEQVEVTIAERRPGDSFDGMVYVLKGAYLTKWQEGGRTEPTGFEQLTFTQGEIDATFTRRNPDGSPGTKTTSVFKTDRG